MTSRSWTVHFMSCDAQLNHCQGPANMNRQNLLPTRYAAYVQSLDIRLLHG